MSSDKHFSTNIKSGLSLWIGLFCFFIFSSSFAQKLIPITDEVNEFVLQNEYLSILEDKNHQYSIEQIASPSFAYQFVLNNSSYPYNQNITSTYWIRFKILNKSSRRKHFILESYAPHTHIWELYFEEQGKFEKKKSGIAQYFYDREYVNKNLILDLPLINDTNTFYVKVHSSNHSSFDYRIKSAPFFFSYSVNEYYFLGMYYGIMIIMAVYNFLLFAFLRERVYLYYIFYVFAGILTTLCDDGIGYQFIWTKNPEWNSLVGAQIAPNVLLITFILYSRNFLQLKKNFPAYDKMVWIVVAIYFVYYLLKITVLPLPFHFHGVYIMPFVVVYMIGIGVYRKGFKPARFMLVGFGFILISIIIIKLRSNGSIEGNLFTVYSFNYGLVLEVLILSFAMGERFRFSKWNEETALKEKNSAQQEVIRQLQINEELQQKVNRELEAKVQARTIDLNQKNEELKEANRKLQEMTDRANEMSKQLDLDNWKLQKKIQESIRERMLGYEVSLEEFNALFPEETACFRYLKELKEHEGFVCYKCKNTEYTTIENSFSIKCNRCGYVESITAHTLFHAIKFPIKSAFYILYIILYQRDNHTLQEIADLTQVGKLSVWKFKQKIELRLDKWNKLKKKRSEHMWESIIMMQE